MKKPERLPAYRTYRNIYNKLIKVAKSNYYTRKLQDVKHDVKKTWRVLNEVISRRKKVNNYPDKLELEQPSSFYMTLNDPNKIADFFNNYFSTVGDRTASSIDSVTEDPLDITDFTGITHSLFLAPTDATEVIKIALSIKSKSSTGHDGVSNKLIKEIIHCIVVPLTHIFNLSMSTGIVPDTYKIAKVIPIYKSGNKLDPSNYRPISLLPSFL